jgi:DNA-binding cell septation regulator SpoVG
MKIRVLDIRLLPGHKTTRAFIDIRLDDVVIKDFCVIQNGDKLRVKAPFTTYRNQNGKLCFRQIIDFPDEVRGRVDAAILSAFYREKEQTDDGGPGKKTID